MTDREAKASPRLSIVVPGDRPETVRRMRAALRGQTALAALEVIVVRWPGAWGSADELAGDGYGAWRVVVVEATATLPQARAAGALAATTPLVFFAETHAYPQPEWAAAVLGAAAGGAWGVVSSSFSNANPQGAVSWAGFLSDYAAYADDLPAGEIESAPIHKAAFRRDDLLAFGERLAPVLSAGDELPSVLRGKGRRVWFAPRARIDHLNVSRLGLWLRGRFLIGYLIGANRAERWGAVRRGAYVLAWPIIAAVLARRTWPLARRLERRHRIPPGTRVTIVAGALARAAGEAIGYAFGALPRLQAAADRYELCESLYAEEAASAVVAAGGAPWRGDDAAPTEPRELRA